jgi:SPP1 family predicted phage head-tail adaptor
MRTDMRHKISIKAPPQEQNEFGEINKDENNWIDVISNTWAAIEPILGREFFAAEAVQSKVEVKFRTHYTPDIENQNTLRLIHGTDTYEIISCINPKGLNRELLFYCKKVR